MTYISASVNLTSARLSQTVADLRERLATTSTEATTGKRSDLVGYLSGKIGDAMLGQKALTDLSDERGMLNLRATRLSVVEASLSRVQDAASGIATPMLSALGTGNDYEQDVMAREALSGLQSVFSSLNARHAERFMFSGDATATPPFPSVDQLLSDIRTIAQSATDSADFSSQIDDYFNAPTGGWQQSIYQGTATASDPDAVTGTHPAITGIVSSLAVLAFSGSSDGLPLLRSNPDIVNGAANRLAQGETALTNLRADQGVIQKHVDDRLASLASEETILTRAFQDMTARDQFEAAAELKELETNLEAAYLLTARLSNLSLLNYL